MKASLNQPRKITQKTLPFAKERNFTLSG